MPSPVYQYVINLPTRRDPDVFMNAPVRECNVRNIWKSFGLFVKTGMCCNENLVDETRKCRATYLITVC